MPQPRTLTKSRFVMGLECPQKLIYDQDKRVRNLKREDSFLASLADGGFQVGEFAKAHFPGGHDIVTLNMDEAVKQTEALLGVGDCVIFEAAIRFQNCFIRVDVLEKSLTPWSFMKSKLNHLIVKKTGRFSLKKVSHRLSGTVICMT